MSKYANRVNRIDSHATNFIVKFAQIIKPNCVNDALLALAALEPLFGI